MTGRAARSRASVGGWAGLVQRHGPSKRERDTPKWPLRDFRSSTKLGIFVRPAGHLTARLAGIGAASGRSRRHKLAVLRASIRLVKQSPPARSKVSRMTFGTEHALIGGLHRPEQHRAISPMESD